jgi:hypothetical protein
LSELTTDCRLLNAVRHSARGGRYPSVFTDVIEKFEMMKVNPPIIA